MSLSEGTGAGVDCEEQNQGSTLAPEGREEVARALYLSMVREVFANSDASTANPHAESIEAPLIASTDDGRRAVTTSGDVDATTLPSSVRAIARGEAGDGLSRLAPAHPRCVDCAHGLVEGERCGGRAAFPCACVDTRLAFLERSSK